VSPASSRSARSRFPKPSRPWCDSVTLLLAVDPLGRLLRKILVARRGVLHRQIDPSLVPGNQFRIGATSCASGRSSPVNRISTKISESNTQKS
jgi:hypothetical protein